ncbi:MAG: glycosyltransferase [Bacteroidetes bacterium]|jgi:dolichol-phosphate mannosyltransferase|nr:glycosyltransferase [Bacteroidota bacterium]
MIQSVPGLKKLSLVVPVYFEEECILQFIKETASVLSTLNVEYEIIFIDDGSADNTVELIKKAAETQYSIKLVELSYNHGKQAAVTAGITYATGDYLLYMDPDLQDPPVEIPRFIEEIEKGFDLVFGIRKEKVDGILNKLFSRIFWGVLEKFTGLKIPKGLAVMRIFNRKFANKFLEYPEQNRFIEGIFMHIGMKRTTLLIAQRERFAGKSKFNFKRKMRLAFDAIFDFSEIPLKAAVRLGFLLFLVGFLYLAGIIIAKLFIIDFQLGWPSIMGAIIIASGLQLFFIGIAAIYIGRTYKESKKRPLFSVKELTNISERSQ